MRTADDVMAFIREHNLEIVDVKFTDIFGQWQHFSLPVSAFEPEAAFIEGLGFDGCTRHLLWFNW